MIYDRRYLLQAFLITTIFIFSNCGQTNSENHPNELNYSFEEIPEFDKSASISNSQLVNLKDRIMNARFESSLDKNKIFGRISDIEIDNQNNIYVLDQDQVEIFKFTPNSLDTLGNEGRGPGELQFPQKMEIDNNSILVADGIKGIISISQHNSDSLKNNDIIFGQTITDIKKGAEGYYLRKMIFTPNPDGSQNTIDYYDLETDTTKYSFGDAYISENRLAVSQYSTGFMEYVPKNNMVLSINYHSPKLSAYQNGNLIWERIIPDFLPFEMISHNVDPVSIQFHEKYREDNAPYDEVKTLLTVGEHIVLLQILRNNRHDELEGNKPPMSYLINTNNGEALFTNQLPQIMAFGDSLFVALENINDTKFQVYSF